MATLSFHQLDRRDVDMLLLNELLKRWERCFATDSPRVEDERLFRSLNMANAAAKLPAGADTNLYDVVRSAALWASAFEILYPAKREAFKGVYAALEGITWNLSDCKDKKYQVFGDKNGPPRSLPAIRGNQLAAERCSAW
ncbi:hypothetical protein QA641_39265 [Bradyrhizobium sp. CB1650]|uniref:hypothetical protein n=1 Tax=Bradyrhizobium sp. CB1650 TaxID=3039153 RepID=UPI002435DC0C|nr:hypothetical protein [Bradyrhizobium sp. CB1650]WGD51426.1 hypothetical protein QA641_39265 [Bradyrhizobium sp. CB1650]